MAEAKEGGVPDQESRPMSALDEALERGDALIAVGLLEVELQRIRVLLVEAEAAHGDSSLILTARNEASRLNKILDRVNPHERAVAERKEALNLAFAGIAGEPSDPFSGYITDPGPLRAE
ncbi:MAG: hypothetical protein Q8P30_02475 [Candidatus Uhrbacteria bacterium]|nr:hypothetical protein [Candidatus Uhrbacteria bacterium]